MAGIRTVRLKGDRVTKLLLICLMACMELHAESPAFHAPAATDRDGLGKAMADLALEALGEQPN
jgi:hypothetical protein